MPTTSRTRQLDSGRGAPLNDDVIHIAPSEFGRIGMWHSSGVTHRDRLRTWLPSLTPMSLTWPI